MTKALKSPCRIIRSLNLVILIFLISGLFLVLDQKSAFAQQARSEVNSLPVIQTANPTLKLLSKVPGVTYYQYYVYEVIGGDLSSEPIFTSPPISSISYQLPVGLESDNYAFTAVSCGDPQCEKKSEESSPFYFTVKVISRVARRALVADPAMDVQILNNIIREVVSVKPLEPPTFFGRVFKRLIRKEIPQPVPVQLDQLLEARKETMTKLAKENPQQFLQLAIKKEDRAKLPIANQAFIEEEIKFDSVFLSHADDFSDPTHPIATYYLTKDGVTYDFYSPEELPGFIEKGSQLEVSGYTLDNIIVGSLTITLPRSINGTNSSQKIAYPIKHKLLVLLLNPQDSSSPSATNSQITNYIFNGYLNNLYKEMSYSKMQFTGDVYGWVPLPITCSTDIFNVFQSVNPYLIQNNISLGNYDHLVIVQNCPSAFAAGSSSIGPMFPFGISVAFSNTDDFSLLGWILAHELGHSLGLFHANGFDCDNKSVGMIGNCQHVEYGNLFDVMGSGYWGYAQHFNGVFKKFLGWISPQEELEITQSGTYTLNALETPGGFKLAKIFFPGFEVTPYYLEYRNGSGFDSNLNNPDLVSNKNGLLIYKPKDPSVSLSEPRLLDMQPTVLNWPDDLKKATLNLPPSKDYQILSIFQDDRSNVTIGPIKSKTPSSITFDISIDNSCHRHEPQIFASPGGTYRSKDDIYLFSNAVINVFNDDSLFCNPANINFSSTFSPPLSSPQTNTPECGSFASLLSPQSKMWWNYLGCQIRIPFATPPGNYSLPLVASNQASGLSSSQQLITDVPPVYPYISISSPPAGSPISGVAQFTLNANQAVSEVTPILFHLFATPVNVTTPGVYVFDVDTTGVTNGFQNAYFEAKDQFGNAYSTWEVYFVDN